MYSKGALYPTVEVDSFKPLMLFSRLFGLISYDLTFFKSYHLKTFLQRAKNDQYLCKLNLPKQNGLRITFTWFLVMMYWRTDA